MNLPCIYVYYVNVLLCLCRCVIDPNAVVFYQLDHETKFSFQYVEFSSSHGTVHLYCNATFCQKNDHSPACQPTCSSNVARSLRENYVINIQNDTDNDEEKRRQLNMVGYNSQYPIKTC